MKADDMPSKVLRAACAAAAEGMEWDWGISPHVQSPLDAVAPAVIAAAPHIAEWALTKAALDLDDTDWREMVEGDVELVLPHGVDLRGVRHAVSVVVAAVQSRLGVRPHIAGSH